MWRFPIHSPTKNQKSTSAPTRVLRVACLTVCCFHAPDLALLINLLIPALIWGISLSLGGANSTLAYFMKMLNFGLALASAAKKNRNMFKKLAKYIRNSLAKYITFNFQHKLHNYNINEFTNTESIRIHTVD